MQHDGQFLGTLPQWISAGAAWIGVVIAFAASQAWRNTLKNKRGDDLLAAIFDLAGIVGSTKSAIDRKSSRQTYGTQVDRIYASLLNLEKSHIIAKRSYKNMNDSKILEIHQVIDRSINTAAPLHDANGGPVDSAHKSASGYFLNLMREVSSLREDIKSSLN